MWIFLRQLWFLFQKRIQRSPFDQHGESYQPALLFQKMIHRRIILPRKIQPLLRGIKLLRHLLVIYHIIRYAPGRTNAFLLV